MDVIVGVIVDVDVDDAVQCTAQVRPMSGLTRLARVLRMSEYEYGVCE